MPANADRKIRADLRILLAVEMRIPLDVHDRREAQSSLVERLAEVGAQHACEDPFVDGPEELFTSFLVYVRGILANDGGNLRIQSAPCPPRQRHRLYC